MAALEENRFQVQILHEFDSCCFRAVGLHEGILDYNRFVQTQTPRMQTFVTTGNFHEVNFRDKVRLCGFPHTVDTWSLTRLDHCPLKFRSLLHISLNDSEGAA